MRVAKTRETMLKFVGHAMRTAMLLVGMPKIEGGQTCESMKEDGATRSHIRRSSVEDAGARIISSLLRSPGGAQNVARRLYTLRVS